MSIFRAIYSVLAGAVCALFVGAAYEYAAYLQPGIVPDPASWKFLYPSLFGIAGFVGALAAICIFYPAIDRESAKAALKASGGGHKASTQATQKKQVASSSKQEVAGMPSFDFDAAKQKINELKAADPSSASVPASPAPPSPTAETTLPQSGSRPEPPSAS